MQNRVRIGVSIFHDIEQHRPSTYNYIDEIYCVASEEKMLVDYVFICSLV
jgi:hypothetical protein